MTTTEVGRMIRLSRHAYDGQPWYGTSLCKLLADVTAQRAAANPIPGAHSIWQEVLHAITWRNVTVGLLSGVEEPPVSEDQNWPKPTDTSPAAWQKTLEELAGTQTRLEVALGALTDERLSEKAPGKDFKLWVLIHGIIQHDVYHAGQIALLKNAG
jgi:uncharacterized damage-inducible protein DinB